MKSYSTIATELRKNTTAVRIHFNWMGTKKTLEAHQRAQAANTFGADKNYLSASQKLLDTRHPAFAKLTKLKNEITGYWKSNTLPFTEDGVRLIHRDRITSFSERMQEYLHDFTDAVADLDNHLWELKMEAKNRLGTLYNSNHYPETVKDSFGLEWDFPSIEPPEYLAQLAPSVYEAEKDRIQQKLQEAVKLAETAFLTEFKDLVATLHDRLTPGDDGKKKIFKDSTVTNLKGFFEKFKDLHLGSNDELEKLVAQAQELVQGIEPDELREGNLLRQEIAKGLSDIDGKLTPLIEAMPRRKIIRPSHNQELTNASEAKEAIPA